MNEKIVSDKYVSIEKLKYRTDKLAYSLAILGLIINVLYFTTLYINNDNFYYSWKLGISVLYNLIFMLLVFLFAGEIKHYQANYAVLLTIIGLLQIVRIFVYPKQGLVAGALSQNTYTILCVYLMASGFLLISSGISSCIKSTILRNFIKNQGLKKL
jgi:hypothetical protein